MMLLSCVNCCHNPLQSDSIGSQYGYCTQHKKILLVPEQLTCGRHLRKDLPIASAQRERELHEARFTPAAVVNLIGKKHAPVNGGHTSTATTDLSRLAEGDKVTSLVLDYGRLETKMAAIAPLHVLDGARAELALLSLGRGYVSWCVASGGKWTSGLHLAWWTRKRLAAAPEVDARDLRTPSSLSITRQLDLAQWSIVMMRLVFIADMARFADGSPFGKLAGLAEAAAEKAGELRSDRLLRWVRHEGIAAFDAALPEKRYQKLADELRKEHAEDG